jgi:hypothetical protein
LGYELDPDEPRGNDVGALLKGLGVVLKIDEKALVRSLGTFVRWAGVILCRSRSSTC